MDWLSACGEPLAAVCSSFLMITLLQGISSTLLPVLSETVLLPSSSNVSCSDVSSIDCTIWEASEPGLFFLVMMHLQL